MKILHICGNFRPGGITNVVKSLIELNESGDAAHDLMLIYEENEEMKGKCKIYYLNYGKENFISCIKEVNKISKCYEGIMIHSAHPAAIFPLVFSKIKCFLFQHGMSVSSGPIWKRTIKKIWYSLIPIFLNAKIICSTQFAFNKARKLGIFLQRKRCVLISFGIKMDNIQRKRKSNTGKKNEINVGMAGRLVQQKRNDMVLKSLKSYKGSTKINLKIAGDGPELENLKKLSDDIKNKKVHANFLRTVKNMDVFYNDLDLFVLPAKDDSFGLVTLEALTRLIPVVVFKDVGGCLSIIKNELNGFVLSNEEGLQSLWKLIDKNPEILSKQSKFIAKMDLSKYDISHTRKELENLVKI